MRKIKFETKMSSVRITVAVILITVFTAVPLALYSSKMDENLVDDVVAMLTNARKLHHTIFLLDTSESMNSFAFSDYIDTCADSKANIDNAIRLCNNSYNQCRIVESNAMCDVDLGCNDILTQCNTLQATKIKLDTFCTKIANIYAEPGETEVVAGPTGPGTNKAKKFIGPWNPEKPDYKEDLCFYDWTEDTGGEVLEDRTSGHWTNPNDGSGYTDRRDWDCLTDGVQQPRLKSGLWLNWKYSTSLDAIKIILADVHDFSYPPRQRGDRKCQLAKYYPYKNDLILGNVCYQEFETNPTGPTAALDLENIAAKVRANWKKEIELDGTGKPKEYPDANCLAPLFTVDLDTNIILSPYTKDGNSLAASTVPCDMCVDKDGNTVDCMQYEAKPGGTATDALTSISGIEVAVDYTCCINYECSDPKCRDDDTTCRSSGSLCVLGYYSDFDQDQNHCCDILGCVEADPSGCGTGGKYVPGPGNDATTEYEQSLGMPALGGSDKFDDVWLTAETKDIDFGPNPDNVDKVIITVYYGCETDPKPSNKIGEKTYTPATFVAGDSIFAAPAELLGCETSGYKVGGTVQLFHSGDDFSIADISVDLDFFLDYTSGSDKDIYVLNGSLQYYSEFVNQATGDPSEKVNEYECKTTFYHKQTYVENGKPDKCNWTKITPAQTRCVQPDHTVIAKDTWGNVKKTACSWLCRDDVVYEDVWKCRAFFSQMDNTARGGSGFCTPTPCPGDDPATLQNCCQCIHNAQATYNYRMLEPMEQVEFQNPDLSITKLNCAVSGFEEGETSEGDRTYTSAYMAEVIKGHIRELTDSSYRLNVANYVSPYNTNKWYSPLTLLERGDSFLKESFTTVFETGKENTTRDIACVYDLMDYFEGDDCADDCGTGCCSVSIGGGTNYCDYPNFWMKIPNTEGGKLRFPATSISGAAITDFKNMVRSLKARGGSTLGETLYDVWRYLGSMKAAHDPNYLASQYPGPFAATDPICFNNNVVVISGGQPQFDDNSSIQAKTTQASLPTPQPWVNPDAADTASPARPYVRSNWYLTSFLNVANFVHTKDFFHANDFCKVDNNVNIYGYEVPGISATGHNCTIPAGCYTDPACPDYSTGLNVIDKVDTVAIGEWTLAPLYNDYSDPSNTYLDFSVLKNAAINTGGKYYTLAAEGADGVETFEDLTTLFNSFLKGSPEDSASGRPHWTSALVQPYDADMKVRKPDSYSPATIPIDNNISRFWFGNLKKYTIDDDSSGCNLGFEAGVCAGGVWDKLTIPDVDCFYLSDDGSDMGNTPFTKIMSGGAARKLEDRVLSAAPTCDSTVGSSTPCFTSGARNILYDNGTDMLELKTADTAWFASMFQLANPTITLGQAVQILDYMYGYDAFDEFPPAGRNHMRYSNVSTVTVEDPFDMTFSGSHTTLVRPLILGAITHSKPIAVHYEDTSVTRIFAGANDGMLHSFDQNGDEAFAYIPRPVLPAVTAFLSGRDGIFFNSSVDGQITLLHIDQSNDGMINAGEKAYLIFGYRRGAKGYTVIDISELDKPKFVQHISTEGYSFGAVTVFRKCEVPAGCRFANDLTYYLAVPGGFDPCHDTDVPLCVVNPMGNEVYIHKLNGSTGEFDLLKKYDMNTPDDNPLVDHAEWMRTSFVATPFAVNTTDRLAVNTEFVYFYDLSSTVFRVDVRKNDPAEWEFRAVFNQRVTPAPIPWGSGIRVYNGPNMFPPLEKFVSFGAGGTTVPIPLVTGNASNTRISEIDEMVVFYDKSDSAYGDPIRNPTGAKDVLTDQTGNGGAPWPGVDAWKLSFIEGEIWEKGVTSPLIVKDTLKGILSGEMVTMSWTTYIPSPFEQCRNFGTSFLYDKQFVDGKSGDHRINFMDCSEGNAISIATSVGMVQTSKGYATTFSSGHEIFLKEKLLIVPNVTNIIKWYELY